MLRPRPVPSSLVLKKGWRTWSWMASGMPGPVSLTFKTATRPRPSASPRVFLNGEGAAPRHGLAGVNHQVDQGFPQLLRVCHDLRQMGLAVEVYRHPIKLQAVP